MVAGRLNLGRHQLGLRRGANLDTHLGHGNDLAYNSNYLGQGPALIATQGSQSAFLSDKVTIVRLNADGSVGTTGEVRLPIGNISGLCYSATAAGGAGIMPLGGWAACGPIPVPARSRVDGRW